MKSVIAFLILFTSISTLANDNQSAKSEAMRVANVILDNPDAAKELNQAYVNIVDYTISEDGKGVNTFTFSVDTTCYCIPKPGTLTVVQDLRPTFVDGPIDYSYNIEWKEN